MAQTFCEVWETVAGIIGEMDVLLGFAELAINAPTPYVRPHMLPPQAGELILTGCRCAALRMHLGWQGTCCSCLLQLPCAGGRVALCRTSARAYRPACYISPRACTAAHQDGICDG